MIAWRVPARWVRETGSLFAWGQLSNRSDQVRGSSMLVDHALTRFGGRTAVQAIDDGVDPREVWRALCADFDVPREQW